MSPVSGFRNLTKLALFLALALLALAAPAQSVNDAQQQNRGFFDSIAKFTYGMAWPTAVYKSWSFAMPVTDADGGLDVVVRLSGLSGWDNSDLWLELGFAFRAGKLDHTVVVRNNGNWPPFKTMQTLGQITAELAQQYNQAHPAPQPARTPTPVPAPAPAPAPPLAGAAMAICVRNQINATVVYDYRWGTDDWSKEQLEAGKQVVYWYNLDAAHPAEPPFTIEYDDSFAEGYTPQRYELKRNAVTLPATCNAAKQYTFTASGLQIVLTGTN